MAYNKYGATKTVVDDIKFDSYLESRHYTILKSMLERGVISELRRQEVIELQPKFRRNGKGVRSITMRPDFTVVFDDGDVVYVESKGIETDDFKVKLKMLWYQNPTMKYVLAKSADTKNLEKIVLWEKEREIAEVDLMR